LNNNGCHSGNLLAGIFSTERFPIRKFGNDNLEINSAGFISLRLRRTSPPEAGKCKHMTKKVYKKDWGKSVRVRPSQIEGKGIFAAKDIPAGELVMVISGEVISGKECERREEEDDNVYIFWNGRYYIDTANTKKIKYINHNCEPNCEVMERDKESLNLVSVREIKAGEEITMDYGYDEIYEICNCSICAQAEAS